MKSLLLCSLLFCALPASLLSENDITESLSKLQSVGPEGEGNVEAAAAWSALTNQGAEIVIPTLQAMEGASPLARNWMRTAVETVFEKQLSAGGDVPADEIRGFVLDRNNEPNARRLAFDLYTKVKPDEAAKLIPGMLDDPSASLRRDAVAQLIDQGKTLLKEGKKTESIASLSKALDAARDVDQIGPIAKLLREDLEQTVDLPKHFGFLMYWDLIAPFDNVDKVGFDKVYPPEQVINFDATYPGKEDAEVAWQDYSTSDDYGMVDFNQPFGPLKGVAGYAFTEFQSADARKAEIRLGCKNAWKIWLNGELLFGRDEYHRGIRIDQYTLPIQLKEGRNTLLVKACQDEQEQDWTVEWQFQLRICDSTGTAILNTDRKPTPSPNAKPRRRPAE